MSKYSKYEAEFMKEAASFPITWKKAKGCYIWDDKGKKYLDFTCGIFVTNVGHSNDAVKKAIENQLDSNLIFAFSFPTEIRKRFVEKLMSMVPSYLNKVALYSTGSGATDRAIQIARKYTGRKYVASVFNSFHGNTALLQDISKSQKYKIPFPMDKTEIDFDEDIKHMESEKICAFILEGFQGWSAYFYPKDYIQKLAEWCNNNNIILIFDEMQSGFKRIGPMFSFQYYDVRPDLVCFGKASAGGLPLAGIIGNEKVMSCMNQEKFASTHSGNTIVMAGALANLEELEKINDVAEKGEYFINLIKQMYTQYKCIDNVTGQGLISAIHFNNKHVAKNVALKCIENGLMVVNTGMRTLKIGPPLTISKELIKEGVDIINKSIEEAI